MHRIRIDRTDKDAMETVFRETNYDVVYDHLAYGACGVSTVLDAVSCGLYVMASSAAVYTLRPGLREEDFLPEHRGRPLPGHRGTGRQHPQTAFYVVHLLNERPMNIDNMDSRISFIHVEEAARLLAFLAGNPGGNSLNAASKRTISLREMLGYMEKAAPPSP